MWLKGMESFGTWSKKLVGQKLDGHNPFIRLPWSSLNLSTNGYCLQGFDLKV
jgi:hypothetical protein